MNGYISISRKLMDWQWYDDSMMVHLWLHLLLSASHEDKMWHGIQLKRGQFVTSVSSISERTGMTIQNIRTRLARLQDDGCITIKPTNKFSIITICKYDSYQSQETSCQQTTNNQITNNQQTTNNQITNNQQTTNNQLTTINKDNNISSSSYTHTCESLKAYDIVDKQHIPVLTDTWIEEVQMMIHRQLRKKVSTEAVKEHYKDFLAQEVTEISQDTYQVFRQHFANYVRKRENIIQEQKSKQDEYNKQADKLRPTQISSSRQEGWGQGF